MSEKKCPSCGASIDLNSTECKYCGEAIVGASPQQNQNAQSQPQPIYTKEENTYTGFEYLKPYYQEQFQRIKGSNNQFKGKWNWCAFFFSWIWGLTKGLWGASLATVGIVIVAGFIDSSLSSIVGLGLSVFWGLRGNYYYYNLVTTKKQFPRS
ncbi:MAG: DUF2628 domain-containing protein [Eubacteriaceae bacterium]|nr:DUF2628 domain-containing protein [Eubacteriaceae bacterium]